MSRPNLNRTQLSAALLACLALLGGCEKSATEEIAAAQKSVGTRAALIHLKSAAAADPKNAQARFLLGQQLFAANEMPAAVIEFKRALELKYPTDELARPLADALLLSGQPDQVMTLVVPLVAPIASTNPKVAASVQAAAAWAQMALRDLPAARQAVDKAEAVGVSPETQMIRARIAEAAGNDKLALELVNALLEGAPQHDGAWYLKGQLLERLPEGSAQAKAAYTKALVANPTHFLALSSMVGIHIRDKDYKAAHAGLDAMRKHSPKAFMTAYYDGQLKSVEGNYIAAREQFRAALDLAPESTLGLLASGINELKLKSYTSAESQLARVVQLDPANPAARFYLARASLAQGKPEQASTALAPLLATGAPAPEVLLVAAQARLLQGDSKGTEALLARAGKLHADHSLVRMALALENLAKGRFEDGIKELELIAENPENIGADALLVNALIARKDYPGALKAAQALERKQPEAPAAYDLRGQVLLSSGERVEARKAFEAALKKDPMYFQSVANLAGLDLMEGKPEQARQRLEAQVKLDPSNAAVHLALVRVAEHSNAGPQFVVAEIDKAINAEPRDVRARLMLIEHYSKTGDLKRALEAARAADAIIPDNAPVHEALAKSLAQSGDTRQALVTYAKLSRIASTDPAGYLGQANLLLANKEPVEAAKILQQLLAFAPGNLEGRRLAIMAVLMQKLPDKALIMARELQHDLPANPLGFVLEGDVQFDQKRWAMAAAAYRGAMAKPNGEFVVTRLHTALVNGNKPTEAQQLAFDWIKQNPKNPLMLRQLAGAAQTAGDSAQAKAYYEQVLELAPKDAAVLNNLAWILVESKDPKALPVAKRAAAEAPDNASVLDTLAQAYAVNSEYVMAIDTQRRAVAVATAPYPFKLRLARLYIAADKRSDAKAELESLRDLGAAFPEAAEVRRLLAQVR